MNTLPLEQLEQRIGHSFSDKALINAALTHSSTGQSHNYERLEFLGDRVLGLVVAQSLYQKFPGENEGDLAKRLAALVQGSLLAKIAAKINLGAHIYFSDAERVAGGADNDHILADVFEAMIGALYLDAGFDACFKLIRDLLEDDFYTMKKPPLHPKTALQEWAQGAGLSLPVYEITGQSGPDHAPVFEVSLTIQGYAGVVAQGNSRQAAEKVAAELMLENLKKAGVL